MNTVGKFVPTGDEDIDRVRREVLQRPTNEHNFFERLLVLVAWRILLINLGVEKLPIRELVRLLQSALSGPPLYRAIDHTFELFGEIQYTISCVTSNLSTPDKASFKNEHNYAEWTRFHGNPQQTGYTEDPGPTQGRLAWKFPIGAQLYSRPVVEGDRVYVISPGTRVILYSLSADTGDVLWKARRDTRSYRPTLVSRSISTPLVLDEVILVRQASSDDIAVIDKGTGAFLRNIASVYLNRYEFPVFTGDSKRIFFPQNINLIAKDVKTGETLWQTGVGILFSDPVLEGSRLFVGTYEGALLCLDVETGRVVWKFETGAPIPSSPAVWDGKVFVGNNEGVLFAFDANGTLLWKHSVYDHEPRAFKFFSTPLVTEGRIYVGAASRHLYSLNVSSGELLWKFPVSDWIRSRPVSAGDYIYAVSIDGTLYKLTLNGELKWKVKVGSHQVFADLTLENGKVFINSADYYLWCLNASDGVMLWRRSLLEAIYRNGRRVLADVPAGGADFQSSPVIDEGKVLIGTPSHFVYAINASTGEEVWRFEAGGGIPAAPVTDAGRVFFGEEGGVGLFYCIDLENGLPIWTQKLGWVWSSANIAHGRVFVPGVNGLVYGLDEETGEILWSYKTGRNCYSSPPVDNERVFFGSWDGLLYAFNLEGTLLWKFKVDKGGLLDSGAPAARGGYVFTPTCTERFYILNASSGEVIRQIKILNATIINVTPAVHEDRVFFSGITDDGNARMYAYNFRDDGHLLWTHLGGGLTGPAVANGKVYFASSSNIYFYCLDEEKGETVWRYRLGGVVHESHPAIAYGKAFVLVTDGYLYAIE